MNDFLLRRFPQVLGAALCLGLAAANALRADSTVALVLAGLLGLASIAVERRHRFGVLVVAVVLGGWWWGSARLDALDRSPLAFGLGTAGRARVVVTAPPRGGRYDIRAPGLVVRFDDLHVREPVLLELPRGRAPPQGAVLETLGQLTAPRGPKNGFDERSWLRRHGMHIVLRVDVWRTVGTACISCCESTSGGLSAAAVGSVASRTVCGDGCSNRWREGCVVTARQCSRASSSARTTASPMS